MRQIQLCVQLLGMSYISMLALLLKQPFLCNAEGVSLVQAQQRERQQRAAVDLKHHIDEAQAGLADKAEVHQTRAKQQADMHAREFNALLESGQNPYAVSRTFCLSHILFDISLT